MEAVRPDGIEGGAALMAHSFSSISTFEKCPREYEARYVLKTVKFDGNEHTRRGDRIHKELENYIKGEPVVPTEAPTDGLHEVLREIRARETAPVHVEQNLAITRGLEPCGFWDKQAYLRGKLDVTLHMPDLVAAFDWKGLALDTPLPTPTGWTTMGDVREGDQVLAGDGRPCRVLGKSVRRTSRGFLVRFDDTTTVICDDQHLWSTHRGVIPITELLPGDKIPLAAPVYTPSADLPLDPYVLGLWLADGKHTSSEITKPDPEVWAEIEQRGYFLGKEPPEGTKCRVQTVLGIRGHLSDLGVLGNKHIPPVYLRASYAQRLDLLRGLMDGDGNVNQVRRQAVFTTCDRRLSDQVYELLCSLGQRVNQARTRQRGFGLEVTAYPLAFRPQGGLNPFLLPRKAGRIDPTWGDGRSWYRRVVCISPREVVESQCIAVDSADNTYLCSRAFVPTHNSGKRRNNSLQAAVYSTMLQVTDPGKSIQVYFDYLSNGRDKPIAGTPDDIPLVMAKAEAIDKAEVYPPRPSRLCGWCPVKTCEFNEA